MRWLGQSNKRGHFKLMRTWTPSPPSPSSILSSPRWASSILLQSSSTDSSRDLLHLLLRGLLVNQLLESDVVTAQVFALLLDADHHLLSVLGRGLAGLADFVPDALKGIVDLGGNELGGGGRDVRGGGDEALGATWAARVGSAAGAESAAGVERTTRNEE